MIYHKCNDNKYYMLQCKENNDAPTIPNGMTALGGIEETNVKLAVPVDDGYILSLKRSVRTQIISKLENVYDGENQCKFVELELDEVAATSEKKTFYTITCIMFWIAFLLIVATFVLALLGICDCKCCRCCNSVKSIFPRATTGSA